MLTIFTIMLEAKLAKATLTRSHISVQFTLTEAKKSLGRQRKPILLGFSYWVKGELVYWRGGQSQVKCPYGWQKCSKVSEAQRDQRRSLLSLKRCSQRVCWRVCWCKPKSPSVSPDICCRIRALTFSLPKGTCTYSVFAHLTSSAFGLRALVSPSVIITTFITLVCPSDLCPHI